MAIRTYRMVDNTVTQQKIYEATGVQNTVVVFDGLPTVTLSMPVGTSEAEIASIDSHMLDGSWIPVI